MNKYGFNSEDTPSQKEIALGIVACSGGCTRVIYGCKGGAGFGRGGEDCPLFPYPCSHNHDIYERARKWLMENP